MDQNSHGKAGCCAMHSSMEWHTRGWGGWGLFRRGETKRIGPLWKLRSFYYFKYESVKFTSYAYLKTLQEQPFFMVFLEVWYNVHNFFVLSIILQIHENNLAINKN